MPLLPSKWWTWTFQTVRRYPWLPRHLQPEAPMLQALLSDFSSMCMYVGWARQGLAIYVKHVHAFACMLSHAGAHQGRVCMCAYVRLWGERVVKNLQMQSGGKVE